MIPLQKFITGARICPTIVAHRGDWSDAPENSLRAIREAARKAFEFVEIDIRRSRDGAFFLLHDCTLDRMTTERGPASDRDLAELVSMPLLAGNGGHRDVVPGEHIPSLAEALAVARGRVYLDLDVKDPEDLPAVARAVATMDMNGFCNLKMKVRDQETVVRLKRLQDEVQIMVKPMAVFGSDTANDMIDLLAPVRPGMVESKFDSLATIAERRDRFQSSGISLWANTLDSVACCGLSDANAGRDPERVWGALVRAGVSIIQTDLPSSLQQYRRLPGACAGSRQS